jgi:hypothetical protein
VNRILFQAIKVKIYQVFGQKRLVADKRIISRKANKGNTKGAMIFTQRAHKLNAKGAKICVFAPFWLFSALIFNLMRLCVKFI